MSDEAKPLSVQERAEIDKRLYEISARVAEIIEMDWANREPGELAKLLSDRLELQRRIPKSRLRHRPR